MILHVMKGGERNAADDEAAYSKLGASARQKAVAVFIIALSALHCFQRMKA